MNGTRAGDTAPGERRTAEYEHPCANCGEPWNQHWAKPPGFGHAPGQTSAALKCPGRFKSTYVRISVVERAGGDEAAGFSEEDVRDDERRRIVAVLRKLGVANFIVLAVLAPARSPEAEREGGGHA